MSTSFWLYCCFLCLIGGLIFGVWRRGVGARLREAYFKEMLARARDTSQSALASGKQVESLVRPLQQQLVEAERKNGEYFSLIERVLKQRDEWRDMFKEHSAQHLNAQLMLETEIQKQRIWLKQSILIVNDYRKKEGQPPLQSPGNLDALVPPIGVASMFERMLEETSAKVPPQIDAVAERDLIAASPGALPPPPAMPDDM